MRGEIERYYEDGAFGAQTEADDLREPPVGGR